MFNAARVARDVVVALSPEERASRVQELETAANDVLAGWESLTTFQTRLRDVIDNGLVGHLGYDLGRWEYDVEVEIWGGGSYMDPSIPDELILRSEYPHGIRLSWGRYEFADWP